MCIYTHQLSINITMGCSSSAEKEWFKEQNKFFRESELYRRAEAKAWDASWIFGVAGAIWGVGIGVCLGILNGATFGICKTIFFFVGHLTPLTAGFTWLIAILINQDMYYKQEKEKEKKNKKSWFW